MHCFMYFYGEQWKYVVIWDFEISKTRSTYYGFFSYFDFNEQPFNVGKWNYSSKLISSPNSYWKLNTESTVHMVLCTCNVLSVIANLWVRANKKFHRTAKRWLWNERRFSHRGRHDVILLTHYWEYISHKSYHHRFEFEKRKKKPGVETDAHVQTKGE